MEKDNLNNAIQRTPEVKVTSGCGSMKTRTIIERVCVRSSEILRDCSVIVSVFNGIFCSDFGINECRNTSYSSS